MPKTGYKATADHAEKIRQSRMGKIMTAETKRKIALKNSQFRHTLETKMKLRGKRGKRPDTITEDQRKTYEYREWRKAIFKRDNYTCVKCGSKEKIQTHHKKPFCLYPELRTAMENGVTLCPNCHKKEGFHGRQRKST